MTCVMCGESMEGILTSDRLTPAHRECRLRNALGGIGHLMDHAHFCLEMHDPDAGMTYRESAKLVDVWVMLRGVDAAAAIEP